MIRSRDGKEVAASLAKFDQVFYIVSLFQIESSVLVWIFKKLIEVLSHYETKLCTE